jgi:quercetin dioxygenase-like cupin family protein
MEQGEDMKNSGRLIMLALPVLCILVAKSHRLDAQTSSNSGGKEAQTRVAIAQALSPLQGDHLKVTVVEVTYPPGGFSAPHSHPCPVVGYVIGGALRTQVKGEPERMYRVGESFYEPANGVHQVSANASESEPAKFLAFFVCDHETALSVPPPSTARAGGK